jgi:hypothetical protein
MSTEIFEIAGRYEAKHYADFRVDYEESTLYVTRFAGGKQNGPMIQITISHPETGYVQLTKEQVKELAQVLSDAYDYDKYPSE